MQAAIEQVARLCRLAALHQRQQSHVLDHFALRMAAADAHHLASHRLQQVSAGPVIFLGKRPRRAAELRHHLSRRKFALRAARLEFGDTPFQRAPVSGHCRQQAHMDIDE